MELHTDVPDTLELDISGMDCADCALTLERGVARLDGVDNCEVSFSTGKMRIKGNVDPDAIERRIRSLGYGIANPESGQQQAQTPQRGGLRGLLDFMLSRKDTTQALIGLGLLLLSAVLGLLGVPVILTTALHLVVVVLAGLPIMINGWRSLILSRDITINLLMSIATIGAIIIGETGEAATVIVLFAIGEALEGYSAERARYSLRALLEMVPQEALTLRPRMDCEEHLGQDGYEGGPCPFCEPHETRVPVSELTPGDVILIPPGERIPMDGEIRSGESAVNQAPITGESVPVSKAAGDEVFAGTINGEGALEVLVTRRAEDNTLNRIIYMVQEAQAQRAPTQRLIDRFARWYTPGIVALALLTATVPPLFFDAPFLTPADSSTPGWLYRALALLIVGCPCALVISTPVTIVSALASAARRGILIKGGAPLEALAKVRAFAFDKTGTLTEGRPELTGVHAVDCLQSDPEPCTACDDLLALAAAVERRSEHPLAHAVVTAAEERRVLTRYPAAQQVASLTGRGVRGQIDGQTVTIGNHALFDAEYPHPDALCREVSALEQQGQTAMLLNDGEQVRGILTVADRPRPASKAALETLKKLHPKAKTVMLTGDNAAVAQAIAAEVGVDDVRAELLPDHKLEAVQQLEAEYGAVAMLGDGINDAPALTAATVGIAMGSSGATQAMETADIVLMQDDLSRLPDVVKLSRRTLRIIGQNVALSLGIKALFLVLTLFGWATLWFAVFADVGASLIVTANGMRLLRDSRSRDQ